jgi:hypothetical protein
MRTRPSARLNRQTASEREAARAGAASSHAEVLSWQSIASTEPVICKSTALWWESNPAEV